MSRWCVIALAACAAPIARTIDAEQVPLAPVPAVRGATPAPDWCWNAPAPLRVGDLRSHYIALQVERAIVARLEGSVADDAFPKLTAVRRAGNPVFVVGPALVEPRDSIHIVRSVEPALAAAWDRKQANELAEIELVGYVQDAGGRDAQRSALTLRHVAADPTAHSRGGTAAELCVVAGEDGSLDVFSRILTES